MGQGCQFTNVSRSKAGRPGQHPTGSGGRLIPMGAGGQHGPPRGGRARVWAPSCPLAPGLRTETRIHTPFSLLRISQAGEMSQVGKRQKSSLCLQEIPVVVYSSNCFRIITKLNTP